MTEIAEELVNALTEVANIERPLAVQAVRAMLRHIGGVQMYVGSGGKFGTLVKPALVSVLGESVANQSLQGIEKQFSGDAVYFPVEMHAFKDEIANEVYIQYDGSIESMAAICCQKGISISVVYRLLKHAQGLRATAARNSRRERTVYK